ncbi:30 kDa heat shock protein [Penicillium longicatenatum]|uniref:30 kDa heat shock protein n=1 Tax=Penicillium longicatenatum TaxID=1561947 RepID=UPI0025498094|nr:30 kDa heat shock protein [Penicillium longicatenatum]KAJ5639111.1 30 kDa heat shock protein [Penicillium longicatenatum]KAJ5651788.1 30 kDa heat shock protein [Penicillium longicatenatum]
MSLQFRSHFPTDDFTRDLSSVFRLFDDYDVHRRANRHLAPRPFTPRFDVRETEDAYHLDGELPGVSQKNIEIEFSDPHNLTVKGRTEREYHTEPEAAAETEENNSDTDTGSNKRDKPAAPRYWVSERTIGEFQRTFTFSKRVDQDAVKASLTGGVLSIVLPKVTATAPKKITIQ